MGNCQATDAAAAVVRHPDGGLERLFWPTTAGELMRRNPGHYVALITFHMSGGSTAEDDGATLRFTRVRILRHKDILFTGQVYRLITCQEVTKALHARKNERTMKTQAEAGQSRQQQKLRQQQSKTGDEDGEGQVNNNKQEREKFQKQRSSGQWRPSLKSISETAGS